jgi:hypothetical protein
MEEYSQNLRDLNGLRNFVYQPVPLNEYLKRDSVSELAIYLTELNPTEEIADPCIFGYCFEWPWPFDKIAGFFSRAFQALEEIWSRIKDFFSWFPIHWLNDTFDKLRDFWYSCRDNLARFGWDPVGFLKGVIDTIVSKIKSFATNVTVNLKDFVEDIWNRLYNFIKPAFDSIVNTATQKVKDLWLDFSNALSNLARDITDPISNTFSWLWNNIRDFFKEHFFDPIKNIWYRMQMTWEEIKLNFTTIGIYIGEFWKSVKLLITQPGENLRCSKKCLGLVSCNL